MIIYDDETLISETKLSTRAKSILKYYCGLTVGEARQIEDNQLLRFPGCGKRTVAEIRRKLSSDPLTLPVNEVPFTERVCWYCLFWCEIEVSGLGNCHRHAPSPSRLTDVIVAKNVPKVDLGPKITMSYWPETGCNEWCGEFQMDPVNLREHHAD